MQRRGGRRRVGGVLGMLAGWALLATFFFPWVSVSCSRSSQPTASGYTAMVGAYPEARQAYPSLALDLVAIVAIIVLAGMMIARAGAARPPRSLGVAMIVAAVASVAVSGFNLVAGLDYLRRELSSDVLRYVRIHVGLLAHWAAAGLAAIAGIVVATERRRRGGGEKAR